MTTRMESRLVSIAHFLDIFWWVWVLMLCWDTLLGVSHWGALALCASRWAIRGMMNTAIRLREDRENKAKRWQRFKAYADLENACKDFTDEELEP